MKSLALPVSVALFALACQSTRPAAAPPDAVRSWGTLRQALRDGEVQGRVKLDDAAGVGVWGVGALEGLAGEVTIADGEVWITEGDAVSPVTTRGSGAGARATVLVAAQVEEWVEVPVQGPVEPAHFDAFIENAARTHGIDPASPFVFRVDGELTDLQLHVIAGQCPMRARALGEATTAPPFELQVALATGQLVGVYAEESAGELCHHGSRTHVHVLLEGERVLTGHVESVGIAAGASLRLPRR